MTAYERITKGIDEHDAAIDAARAEILAIVENPFNNSGEAYEMAKAISKYAGTILSRLAQAREAKRILGLLDHEAENLLRQRDLEKPK